MTFSNTSIEDLVVNLSSNYTSIITRSTLKKHKKLNWGNNGLGDRWANKLFNYSSIYSNGSYKTYSEDITHTVPDDILKIFLNNIQTKQKQNSIIGIFVHSKRTQILLRPISKNISDKIKRDLCASCGSSSNIICDHKNDLYNDKRVLNVNSQSINDFQALCIHCNLLKRQINNVEKATNKLFSATLLPKYKQSICNFPWEKKAFDINDENCKKDTYWYDPIEFNKKYEKYLLYVYPILNSIKSLQIN